MLLTNRALTCCFTLGSSSAQEGSQQLQASRADPAVQRRHQPRRVRNNSRRPVRTQPSSVVISPGGFATAVRTARQDRGPESSSAQEGSQHDDQAVIRRFGRRRHQPRRVRNMASRDWPAAFAWSSSAQEGSQHGEPGLAGGFRVVVISPGGFATDLPVLRTPLPLPSSSAQEGSQHPGAAPAADELSGRHQPRRVRNTRRRCRASRTPTVVISPGGFATLGPLPDRHRRQRVVISPGGFATLQRILAMTLQTRRHQPRRVRNRRLNIMAVVLPRRRHQPRRVRNVPLPRGRRRPVPVVISPGGFATLYTSGEVSPHLPSSSAQEGSQQGERHRQQGGQAGRHQPRRVRNWKHCMLPFRASSVVMVR